MSFDYEIKQTDAGFDVVNNATGEVFCSFTSLTQWQKIRTAIALYEIEKAKATLSFF